MARTDEPSLEPKTRIRHAPRSRAVRWRKAGGYLFLLPALAYIALTMLYPVAYNIRMSLEDVNVRTFLSGDAPFVGLDNYRTVIDDPAFRHAIGLSLIFTAGSLLFQFTIGFALALFFNRPFPGNGALRALFLLGWMLPTVVSGSIFRWMLDGDFGVINYALRELSLIDEPRYWLIDPDTALAGTILANIWVGIPFNMVLLLAGLQSIPPTLYEAASVDGANAWQRFRSLTAAADAPGLAERAAAGHHLHLQGLRPDLRHDRRRTGRRDDGLADLRLPAHLRVLPLRRRRGRGHAPAGRADRRGDRLPLVEPARGGGGMNRLAGCRRGGLHLDADRHRAGGRLPLPGLLDGRRPRSKRTPDIYANPPKLIPIPLEWENYREAVFDNPPVLKAIRSSVIISIGTMLLTLVLAAPAAYALARLRLRGGALVILLLLVSQLLPGIVIAGPLFVLFSRIDLVNSYLGLILADTSITLPFAVIILRPFFLTVPMELEAAALVDGSTRFGAFWRIVVPLVRPGLITVSVFAFLFTWGEFVFALSLTTNEDVQPITVALNKFIGQYGTQWNLLMAVATTVAIPIIVVFAGLQRYIVGGLTAGATKE